MHSEIELNPSPRLLDLAHRYSPLRLTSLRPPNGNTQVRLGSGVIFVQIIQRKAIALPTPGEESEYATGPLVPCQVRLHIALQPRSPRSDYTELVQLVLS